jgi:hypothetical protein
MIMARTLFWKILPSARLPLGGDRLAGARGSCPPGNLAVPKRIR